MTYQVFSLLVSVDGLAKRFEIAAVSLDSAMADLREALAGEVLLIQYGVSK